jgi:hypothetical protein
MKIARMPSLIELKASGGTDCLLTMTRYDRKMFQTANK